MTALPNLADLASRWIEALAVQSVNASVVFAAVLLATSLLRRRGPAIHLALWSLVFVRLVLPPTLSHPWSVGSMLNRFAAPSPIGPSSVIEGFVADVGGNDTFNGAASDRSSQRRVPIGLAAVWLFGVAGALVVYRRRLAPFQRAAGAGRPVSDPKVLEVSERWRRCLRIRRRVRVVTSPVRLSPFTIGVFRPVIFLPKSIADDRRSVEPAIAHEMAHVARWDALGLGLQHVVQAIYFFHPLVWIAGSRLDRERERLCDATVVAAGRIPAHFYVGGLLNVLRLDLQGAGAPTMTVRKRRIGVRIQKILERDGAPQPRLAASAAAAMLVGVFVLPLGQGRAGMEVEQEVQTVPGVAQIAAKTGGLDLENPLPGGRVTWTWGPGRDPWTGKEVFHRGIDVAAKAGTPVLAPADGVVVVATEDFEESPASGTVVMVDHGDGWTTFYAHLGSLGVTEGERVAQDTVIATVGSTGKSTGPHLHFEVRRDGEALNPADHVSDWD